MSQLYTPEHDIVFITHPFLILVLSVLLVLLYRNLSYRKKFGFAYRPLKFLSFCIVSVIATLSSIVFGIYLWSITTIMDFLSFMFIVGISNIFIVVSSISWILFVDSVTDQYNTKKIEALLLGSLIILQIFIFALGFILNIPFSDLQHIIGYVLIACSIIYLKASLHLSLYGYRRFKTENVTNIQKFTLVIYTLNLPLVLTTYVLTVLNRLENKFFGQYALLSWLCSILIFILLYLSVATPKWLIKLLSRFEQSTL